MPHDLANARQAKKPRTKNEHLTPRQSRFIAEYLICLNATSAAIKAGYSKRSAHVQAAVLLNNPKVSTEISRRQAKRADALEYSALDVLRDLVRLASLDVADAFDSSGRLLPIHQMPADVRKSIAAFEVLIRNVSGGDGHQDTIHRVKFWDKNRALETLAKHYQLLVERTELHGTVTFRWEGDDEFETPAPKALEAHFETPEPPKDDDPDEPEGNT
jgi:phage terminase small subunit